MNPFRVILSQWQDLLDALDDGILIVDAELRICAFNRAAEALTGFRREETLGKRCCDICGEEACLPPCAVDRILARRQLQEELATTIRTKDGQRHLVHVRSALLHHPRSQPVAVLRLQRDVPVLRQPSGPVGHTGERGPGVRCRYGRLVGASPPMQALYALLDRICQTEATVLIQGETGTGKELVAETIHAHSARAGGPLVRVNCAALPESLLESELFGHEKGAFTDAVSAKPGLFEVAHTGTIFLDEIGAMRWSTQAKLLRVLESQEFQRLGGTQTLRMEVRVLAATNRDLATALAQGEFREDLFYRLNVIPLFLPPLRERKEDLFLLVEHFLERLRRDGERNITHVTPEAMEVLRQYDFPGNVRDLENALQYAFVVCRGDAIQPADLPLRFHRTGGFPGPVSGAAGREALTTAPPRGETPEAMLRLVGDERERVRTALEATRWSMKEGAALLHIDRSTLWRKMKKYDLARPQQVS